MSSIEVRNNLTAPHKGKSSPLHALISARTQSGENSSAEEKNMHSLWTVDWWGLSSSHVFITMNPEMQIAALSACNRAVLNEAYFIEKSGLAYTAKMVLSAESTDVAQLYALIGADEARHLAWIEPYLEEEEKCRPGGQFLAFLSRLVEDVEPRLLIYLVQIILEGWGLDHYKRLADGCQQPMLSHIWSSILKDEALHHKSGTILFDGHSLSAQDLLLVEDCLKCYADMVRVGPQAAVRAVDEATGGLTQEQLEDVLLALRHPQESARKLRLLHDLMRQPGLQSLVDRLSENHQFVPMSVQDAARSYLGGP